MIAALLAFLGGNVFRLMFGEIVAFLDKRQAHAQEIERMRLQGELDAAQHERSQSAIRLQAELGVKTIQVQGEAYSAGVETDAWFEAVKGTTKPIGVWWVDAWNMVIRPFLATWAIAMITVNTAQTGWVLDANGWSLCGAALGIFVADRSLFKRGR